MFYDLNIEYTPSRAASKDGEIPKTVSFLAELGYNVIALNYTLAGKLPSDLSCAIPEVFPFPVPSALTILRRCTLILSEPATNNRIAALSANYDILAVRPVDERTFQHACNTAECDLISLDLTQRLGYHFKFKTVSEAIQRGIRFEVCYGQGLLGESQARRNLISNVTQLIRATRGRGIIFASEAKRAMACRAPWDVINLATVWGLPQDRAHEAVSKETRSVVVSAQLKRSSYRGVVAVVYGGEKPANKQVAEEQDKSVNKDAASKKRKAESLTDGSTDAGDKPLSKRELKRRARAKAAAGTPTPTETP